MPVKKCTTKGRAGRKYGSKGKCYPGKSGKRAAKQGRAIERAKTKGKAKAY